MVTVWSLDAFPLASRKACASIIEFASMHGPVLQNSFHQQVTYGARFWILPSDEVVAQIVAVIAYFRVCLKLSKALASSAEGGLDMLVPASL